MRYRIELTRAARKALASVPRRDLRAVDAAILSLADEPRPPGHKKLRGKEGFLRVRAGAYRVVYQVEDEVLVVVAVRVGHRKEIYREISRI